MRESDDDITLMRRCPLCQHTGELGRHYESLHDLIIEWRRYWQSDEGRRQKFGRRENRWKERFASKSFH